ncbi:MULTISPECIES: hypothetical protein [unclassified Variovorax]|uniref:hypothetical protein n=1 Tax=unclassified Variovorax TaxID=663243 RepID=UPI00117DB2A3|nr:hypothetical protein [Variovorax sp. YR752]
MKALGVGEHLHVRFAAPLVDCELRADVEEKVFLRGGCTVPEHGDEEAIRNAERHMNQQHIVRLRAAGKNLRQPGSRPCIQSQGVRKGCRQAPLHCV